MKVISEIIETLEKAGGRGVWRRKRRVSREWWKEWKGSCGTLQRKWRVKHISVWLGERLWEVVMRERRAQKRWHEEPMRG